MNLLAKSKGHSRLMPTGRKVAAILRAYFKEQLAEVIQGIRRNRRWFSLGHWTEPMVQTLTPVLAEEYAAGAADATRRIRARKPVKDVSNQIAADAFDVFNPMVLAEVRKLALAFCESTNATSTLMIEDALTEFRRSLAQGLARGDSLKTLTARVQGIFADPMRAMRIAATETSRAMHAGQFALAESTGVVQGKRWLASSDACDLCLELNGKEVGLHDDFAVNGIGPYAAIPYPPAHPNCMCTWTEVIG